MILDIVFIVIVCALFGFCVYGIISLRRSEDLHTVDVQSVMERLWDKVEDGTIGSSQVDFDSNGIHIITKIADRS